MKREEIIKAIDELLSAAFIGHEKNIVERYGDAPTYRRLSNLLMEAKEVAARLRE